MSFEGDLGKFADKTDKRLQKTFQGVVIAIFSRVIARTPVDTGRLRANRQTDINNVPSDEVDATDKSGSKAISDAVREAGRLEVGDRAVLVNNLPYAGEIERGSSTQAPEGMVARTITEFQRLVKEVGRKS